MKKNILITGSNKGIGFEIARQCGKLGFHVILSGRDKYRLKSAIETLFKENIKADSILMDVSNPKSIENAAKQFILKKIQLDVLVNNAGIGIKGDRSLTEDDEDTLNQLLCTNSYGPLRVTKSFLPFMPPFGRIIMISSGGGTLNGNTPRWSPAYCVSKTLLNAITKHLAHELKAKNISVNAVCPGWVHTDMGGKAAPRSVEEGAETPVWLINDSPQELTGMFFRDKKPIPW